MAENERVSTSDDPEVVRAAGEGMTKKHSKYGDERIAREEAAKAAGKAGAEEAKKKQ